MGIGPRWDLKAAESRIKELELYQKRDKDVILQLENQVWKHAERINELEIKGRVLCHRNGCLLIENADLRKILDTVPLYSKGQ